MAKNCPHCMTELPDDAAFCYECGKPQSSKKDENRPMPKWLPLVSILVLLLSVYSVFNMSKPKDYMGTYELDYTAEDDRIYHLALSFSFDPAVEATESTSVSGGTPVDTCLYVTDAAGENALSAFAELIEDVHVIGIPVGGAYAAELSESGHDENVWNCVTYNDSTCGTNIIRWTIDMENGDKLIISHQVEYTE